MSRVCAREIPAADELARAGWGKRVSGTAGAVRGLEKRKARSGLARLGAAFLAILASLRDQRSQSAQMRRKILVPEKSAKSRKALLSFDCGDRI